MAGNAGEEMGDVLVYLIRLADVLDIDLGEAAAVLVAQRRRRQFLPPRDAG
jgi:dCTP diphosphatase